MVKFFSEIVVSFVIANLVEVEELEEVEEVAELKALTRVSEHYILKKNQVFQVFF